MKQNPLVGNPTLFIILTVKHGGDSVVLSITFASLTYVLPSYLGPDFCWMAVSVLSYFVHFLTGCNSTIQLGKVWWWCGEFVRGCEYLHYTTIMVDLKHAAAMLLDIVIYLLEFIYDNG